MLGLQRRMPGARARRLSLAALLVAPTGCGDCNSAGPVDTPVPGMFGELGYGEFFYDCITASDPICRADEATVQFPACIAVGGSFEMRFRVSNGPDASVSSLDPSFFAELGGDDFEARQVGTSALLAWRTDEVVDYLDLEIVQPDDFEIRHAVTGSTTSITLMRTGTRTRFDVMPVSQLCFPIGGSLAFFASSSDPLVVSATYNGGLELLAEAPGEATVTVEVGSTQKTITVVVSDPPKRWPPDPDGTGTGTGTGTDTGTGTGTGSDTATETGTGTATATTMTGSSNTGGTTGTATTGSTTTP